MSLSLLLVINILSKLLSESDDVPLSRDVFGRTRPIYDIFDNTQVRSVAGKYHYDFSKSPKLYAFPSACASGLVAVSSPNLPSILQYLLKKLGHSMQVRQSRQSALYLRGLPCLRCILGYPNASDRYSKQVRLNLISTIYGTSD